MKGLRILFLILITVSAIAFTISLQEKEPDPEQTLKSLHSKLKDANFHKEKVVFWEKRVREYVFGRDSDSQGVKDMIAHCRKHLQKHLDRYEKVRTAYNELSRTVPWYKFKDREDLPPRQLEELQTALKR